jgi:general stress protein 26
MPTEEQSKVCELLHAFDVGVLVTTTEDGDLHARPMAIAQVDDDCTTWFVTSRSSPKIDEVHKKNRAHVVCQRGATAFLSMSGEAAVVDDRARLEGMWKVTYEPWFPQGKDDPDLTLLRVKPERGEYWDGRGLRGVKYVLEAAKAIANGTRVRIDEPGQHGRTKM